MEKRKIGNLEVSSVGFGCMGLSHAYGVATDRIDAVNLIREAVDAGYTLFDTAECYTGTNADGTVSYNEELVGEALRPIRNQVVIATKFGVKHGGDHLILDSRPSTIRSSCEGSLKKLGIETIDLYYQHRIDPNTSPEKVAETMKSLMAEGKIRHWGISEVNEEYLRRANAVCHVTTVENRYSMMARWHETLFPVLEELGIGFVAFSPMANGLLTGKYLSGSKFAEGDFRNDMPQYTPEALEQNKQLLEYVDALAAECKATAAQVSMAWMLCKKPYIVPIPGTRKKERMIENAGAASVKLKAEEVKKIDDLLNTIHTSEVFGGHSGK